MRRLIGLAALALLVGTGAVWAQSSLGVGPSAGELGPPPTSGLFGWLYDRQQDFFKALQGALRAIKTGDGGSLFLIGLSFAYGIFHAAGPGHGKVVLSTYMLANETALRRGVVLSFLSGFAQAVTAIVVVGSIYLVLRGTSITMTGTTRFLELASYVLIAGFGLTLLYRKMVAFRARPVLAHAAAGHGHHHDDHAHETHHHHHDHDHDEHGVCQTCGHNHAPDPRRVADGTMSIGRAWSVIAAIGMRPCSGAIIVLSFALLNGLYLAGILSVFAMAIGTSITVSALATLAVLAKGTAQSMAEGSLLSGRIGPMIEVAAALLLVMLGAGMLITALQA